MGFIFTYLHILSIISLVSLLTSEFFIIKNPIDDKILRLLKKIDLYYGILAVLVLATGLARIFLEKGLEYYIHSYVFWLKMMLFIIIGSISLLPTLLFIKAKAGADIDAAQYIRLKKAILLQIMIVPFVVLCAIYMARGYY
jgi:putative membrane protein